MPSTPGPPIERIRRRNAVAGHQDGLHTLVTHLADEQAAFRLQTAPDQTRSAPACLMLGADGGIILLAGIDAFIQNFRDAEFGHVVLRGVREAFAVGRLVCTTAIFLPLSLSRARSAHSSPAGRRGRRCGSVPQLAIGELRIGRGRGDQQNAVFRVDVGSRDRHAGVEVADDEFDAVADELVGDRTPCFGIGNVVALLEGDLLAENAAGLVDVLDRLRVPARVARRKRRWGR